MGKNQRPVNSIDLLSLLPGFYAKEQGGDGSLLSDFLKQFEEMFDDLQAAIVGDGLTLTYKGPGSDKADSYALLVELFDGGRLDYPENSYVFIPDSNDLTYLSEPIIANSVDQESIWVTDRRFRDYLKAGDKFVVHTSSGLAGLTSTRETPPIAFRSRGEEDKLAYLQYLASWVGLPVRSDKPVSWNRRFLREAMAFDNDPKTQRATLSGIKVMLNAWLYGEIVTQKTIVTDLVSPENGVDTVFQLGVCRIGVDTLLGEGQPGRFHVHLTVVPDNVSMRDPKKIEAMIAAARLILDMEKPVNTEYTLHIDVSTMQIAPDAAIVSNASTRKWLGLIDREEERLLKKDTNTYLRIGETTLLWD